MIGRYCRLLIIQAIVIIAIACQPESEVIPTPIPETNEPEETPVLPEEPLSVEQCKLRSIADYNRYVYMFDYDSDNRLIQIRYRSLTANVYRDSLIYKGDRLDSVVRYNFDTHFVLEAHAFKYDDQDRIIRVANWGSMNSSRLEYTFTYDALGRLEKVQRWASVTRYEYNDSSSVTRVFHQFRTEPEEKFGREHLAFYDEVHPFTSDRNLFIVQAYLNFWIPTKYMVKKSNVKMPDDASTASQSFLADFTLKFDSSNRVMSYWVMTQGGNAGEITFFDATYECH